MSANNTGTEGMLHMERRRDSIRVIMEGLILVGIVYVAGSTTQQSKDIAVIKVTTDNMAKNTDKVPDLIIDVRALEERQNTADKERASLETRVSDLEKLRIRVK